MLYWLLEQSREWLIDKNLYTFVRVLDQVQFRALAAGVLAFAFVVLFGKRTIDWLRRKKIGDSGVTDAAALAAQASQKEVAVPRPWPDHVSIHPEGVTSAAESLLQELLLRSKDPSLGQYARGRCQQ